MSVERIAEYADSRGVALTAEEGVIRGVKILGLASKNGREYLPAAVSEARALYEGAKVNVNHTKTGAEPRDYRDRLGTIKNVRETQGGLYADLHYNPKNPVAEQLAWDAAHAPENVGFSHVVDAQTARRGGRLVVESIKRVQSVDLVADPATTQGLFEHHAEEANVSLTIESLKADHPQLIEALRAEVAAESQETNLREQVAALTAELAEHRAKAAAAALDAEIDALFAEHALPEFARTDQLRGTLRESRDAASRGALVQSIATVVAEAAQDASGKPRSKEQASGASQEPLTQEQFARRIFA